MTAKIDGNGKFKPLTNFYDSKLIIDSDSETYFIGTDIRTERGDYLRGVPIQRFDSIEDARRALPRIQHEYPSAYCYTMRPE